MCGIGALVRNDHAAISSREIQNFNDCIAHRGPDGEGTCFFDSQGNSTEAWQVALFHRRLSILDLSDSGKQPMTYSDGKFWIVFNGEIYNYIELRTELQQKGFSFQSTSDTEVILAAYRAWGTGCFERMRGMWGIVIYDVAKGKLVASRDRMGIKPLYYYQGQGYVAFASEIKQFVQLKDFNSKGDNAVIKQYLLTGFERVDRSFFENVRPILPGTSLEVDIGSLSISAALSFWNPEYINPSIHKISAASEIFSDVLNESVRIHLRSDVPVGCQLSGGVDSSSIFSLMQAGYTGDVIHSFTIAFPGFEKDETPFVNEMLRGTKTVSHFTTPVPGDFIHDLRSFIWHHDEPVGSFAHYAGFVLAKLISDAKIKVVLNGQGGDEILGGYWQQYYSYLFSLTRRLKIGSVFSHLAGALSPGGNAGLITQAPAMLRRFKSRNKREPFQFTGKLSKTPSLHFFEDYFLLDDQQRRVFEIRNLILPRLLKWDDRNLMAFGVEGRYPFLDHKVIEAALSFDTMLLFRKGWTKYPLRLSMRNRIPRSIYFRKSKWGFETPQQNWLSMALRPVLEKWLKEEKPLNEMIRPQELNTVAQNCWKTGNLEDAQALLRLFLMDQWMKVFSIKLT